MKAEIKARPELKVMDKEKIHHILEPGEVGAILELTVTDKDGKVTEHRVLKSESFVRQFLELLWIQAYQIIDAYAYDVRDTGNVLRGISQSWVTFACNACAGVITNGIVVGTDDGTITPLNIGNYALGAIILHDAAPPTPNRLQYSIVTFGAPASDATTSQFTITRNFANASGGAITVNEIGLYVQGHDPNTIYYFMTIRDLIAGGINVPNGQTLTVNYRIQAVI